MRKIKYWVEYETLGGIWRRFTEKTLTRSGWRLDLSFDSQNNALKGLSEYKEKHHYVNLRIVDDIGNIFYKSCLDNQANEWEGKLPAGGTEMPADTGNAPLHIERTALITALETRLEEEQAKRQEAETKRTESRKAVLEAVSKLTDDQIANILHNFVIPRGNDELEKWVDDVLEEGKFVSQELQPTVTETSLEKYVRVLGMAKDEEIEVEATDPLYPLL